MYLSPPFYCRSVFTTLPVLLWGGLFYCKGLYLSQCLFYCRGSVSPQLLYHSLAFCRGSAFTIKPFTVGGVERGGESAFQSLPRSTSQVVDLTFLGPFQRENLVRSQKEEEENLLKAIPLFCFPDGNTWAPLTEYERFVHVPSVCLTTAATLQPAHSLPAFNCCP